MLIGSAPSAAATKERNSHDCAFTATHERACGGVHHSRKIECKILKTSHEPPPDVHGDACAHEEGVVQDALGACSVGGAAEGHNDRRVFPGHLRVHHPANGRQVLHDMLNVTPGWKVGHQHRRSELVGA